jgi:hypothetical protein
VVAGRKALKLRGAIWRAYSISSYIGSSEKIAPGAVPGTHLSYRFDFGLLGIHCRSRIQSH